RAALLVTGEATVRVERIRLAAGVDGLPLEPAVVGVAPGRLLGAERRVRVEGETGDLVLVVRPAELRAPYQPVRVVQVDGRELYLQPRVPRGADVLQRRGIAGGPRQAARQQQVAGVLPVPVHAAGEAVPEETEIGSRIGLGGLLPSQVRVGRIGRVRVVRRRGDRAEVDLAVGERTLGLVRADGRVAGLAVAAPQLQAAQPTEALHERLVAQ